MISRWIGITASWLLAVAVSAEPNAQPETFSRPMVAAPHTLSQFPGAWAQVWEGEPAVITDARRAIGKLVPAVSDSDACAALEGKTQRMAAAVIHANLRFASYQFITAAANTCEDWQSAKVAVNLAINRLESASERVYFYDQWFRIESRIAGQVQRPELAPLFHVLNRYTEDYNANRDAYPQIGSEAGYAESVLRRMQEHTAKWCDIAGAYNHAAGLFVAAADTQIDVRLRGIEQSWIPIEHLFGWAARSALYAGDLDAACAALERIAKVPGVQSSAESMLLSYAANYRIGPDLAVERTEIERRRTALIAAWLSRHSESERAIELVGLLWRNADSEGTLADYAPVIFDVITRIRNTLRGSLADNDAADRMSSGVITPQLASLKRTLWDITRMEMSVAIAVNDVARARATARSLIELDPQRVTEFERRLVLDIEE